MSMSGYAAHPEFALGFAKLETRTVQRGVAMSIRSAAGEEFLTTLESWLVCQAEVLVLIRYSRAAGKKDIEFYTSFVALQERFAS
jgi:hypothetical protein